jgi:hypothetical protein
MQVQLAPSVTALRQTVPSDQPLPAVVDQLTDVQVAIAVLENLEANLKATLVKSGLKEICGSKTRAVVSVTAAGVTVSWSAVAKALNPSDELLAKHSKVKDPVTSVKLYGYN